MYNEATAHKILRAAPVRPVDGGEDGETGFDPDDAALDKMFHHEDEYEEDLNNPVTPLIYFAYKGDLKNALSDIQRSVNDQMGWRQRYPNASGSIGGQS